MGRRRSVTPVDGQVEALQRDVQLLETQLAGAERDHHTRQSFIEQEVVALESRLDRHLDDSDEGQQSRSHGSRNRHSKHRPSRHRRHRQKRKHARRKPRRKRRRTHTRVVQRPSRHHPRRSRHHRPSIIVKLDYSSDTSSSGPVYELQKLRGHRHRRSSSYSETYTYSYTYTYYTVSDSDSPPPRRKKRVAAPPPRAEEEPRGWTTGDRSIIEGAGPPVHDKTPAIDEKGRYGAHDRDVVETGHYKSDFADYERGNNYQSEFADFDEEAQRLHAQQANNYKSDFAQFDDNADKLHSAPPGDKYRSDFVGYDDSGAAVYNNNYKSDFVGYDDSGAPIFAQYKSDFAPLAQKQTGYKSDFARYGDNPMAYRSDFVGYTEIADDLLHKEYNTDFAGYNSAGWKRNYDTDYIDFKNRRKKYRKRVRPREGESDDEDRITALNEKMDRFSRQMARLLKHRESNRNLRDYETEILLLERRLAEVQTQVHEEVESYDPSYSYSYSWYSGGGGGGAVSAVSVASGGPPNHRPRQPANFVYLKPQARQRRHRRVRQVPRMVYQVPYSYSYSYYSEDEGASSTIIIAPSRHQQRRHHHTRKHKNVTVIQGGVAQVEEDDRLRLLQKKFAHLEKRLDEAGNRYTEQARFFEKRLEDAEDQAEYVEKNVTRLNRKIDRVYSSD